ncbi:MAG: adenosylcobinamide-GDP ribazoletransferase [Deltaproteobacteria bacterium]|nr:adenosylcobinamide-GDP ribazoletransferase [Deltaproteobacteria bacterium]
MFKSFCLALSFLSRLIPGRSASVQEIYSSIAWYPAAGLMIGLVASFPFALGLAEGKFVLQGFLFTTFLAWLTRALHWDGWADVFDALGSGRQGEEFRQVLKDSRVGVFGALALVLGLAGMIIGSSLCLAAGNWTALPYAVLLGRCLAAPLAFATEAAPSSSLGVLFCAGTRKSHVVIALCFALAGGLICLGPFLCLLSIVVAGCGLFFFRLVALRHGGMGGDFIGATIIWGELGVLLTVALFQ